MATTHPAPGDPRVAAPNQPPPLAGLNTFETDAPLAEALEREGGGWAHDRVRALGAICGDPAWIEKGTAANEHPPALKTFDRFGNRIDEASFHPAWHELLALGVRHGLHALPWQDPRPGAHVARAALFIQLAQVEAGVGCPLSMTYSAVPALRAQPELAAAWEPRLASSGYEPALDPPGGKASALAGMAMTEKQGGSDVRANLTAARPLDGGGPGAEYALDGHKWFCSAPMCDVFLVLAQAPGGLTCFLVPRVLPDGTRNVFRLQRLKDKLGNRSNASSEVEFQGTWAQMVGEEGRGVPTIIEMVGHTRLDCVIGASAGMRQGVAQATWHAAHRSAFGKTLIDQPLMTNVLADLCVESEAATVTAMRLARAYDEASDDPREAGFKRVATAVAKYWTCKRAPGHAAEALECLGGNGFVEESGMPRLFRESPLGSIWEGSGNVQCLDVLRALSRSPETLEAFLGEVREAAGADPRLDAAIEGLEAEFSDLEHVETRSRRIVERMATTLQGSLLVRHGDAAVADAFCASRLAGDGGLAYGTLPPGADPAAIVARHTPQT
jgi:putative acyl-CoA dehydrogenase